LKYVIDSNIAIAAMNGVASVVRRLAEIDVSDIGIPLVAIGELVYGAYRSKRRDENLSRIAGLRRSIATLPLTDEIVDRYGATRADLHSRGIAKSDFDLLIACTALAEDAVLVTNDQGLLDGSITGLEMENWLA
jgi:predicted nucleic acid-binding protein